MSSRSNIIKSGLKEIPGFLGYFVSEYGDVYSIHDPKVNFILRKLNPWKDPNHGQTYLCVSLSKAGKKFKQKVHRLILFAFIGPCPPGYVTRHLDGDGSNNRLDNLTWGTVKENAQDKKRHGISGGEFKRGHQHNRAKLNDHQVRRIRRLYANGWTQEYLASKFIISRGHISKIVNRKTWQHIREEK